MEGFTGGHGRLSREEVVKPKPRPLQPVGIPTQGHPTNSMTDDELDVAIEVHLASQASPAERGRAKTALRGGESRRPSRDTGYALELIQGAGIGFRVVRNTWYAMLSSDSGDCSRVDWHEYTCVGGKRYGYRSYEVLRRRCRYSGDTLIRAGLRCYVSAFRPDYEQLPDHLMPKEPT
jgi:hypothetical protein